MSILVTSKKFSNCDKELAFKDIEEVHKIRGRILHFSSILEAILKDLVTKKIQNIHKNILKNKKGNIKSFGKLDLNDRIKLFLEFLNNQFKFSKDKKFNKLKSNLNVLRQNYRNPQAHGFVYYQRYEKDKKDSEYKPLNFIRNNQKRTPIHFKSKHFDVANKIFPEVFKWIEDNGFLKIKYYSLELR